MLAFERQNKKRGGSDRAGKLGEWKLREQAEESPTKYCIKNKL